MMHQGANPAPKTRRSPATICRRTRTAMTTKISSTVSSTASASRKRALRRRLPGRSAKHLVTFLAEDRDVILKMASAKDFLVQFADHVRSRTGRKWSFEDLEAIKGRLFMHFEQPHARQPIRYEDWRTPHMRIPTLYLPRPATGSQNRQRGPGAVIGILRVGANWTNKAHRIFAGRRRSAPRPAQKAFILQINCPDRNLNPPG